MVLVEQMMGRKGWMEALCLLPGLAVLPHAESTSEEAAWSLRHTLERIITLVAIDSATCCLSVGEGRWQVLGQGRVRIYRRDEVASYPAGSKFSLVDE